MPGKQYISVTTLFQSILNIWTIPGSEMDLVLDNSLHYLWFALDLLIVLLVCFLVAKLSDTNLLVFKKEKQPQQVCFKNFITYLLLLLWNTAFSSILVKRRSLCPFSLHTQCTGLGFAHLLLVHALEHVKQQSVCLNNVREKWKPRT